MGPLSNTLSPTFFEQLCSEKLVLRYVKGMPVKAWERKPGALAKALDAACYGLAVRDIVKVDLTRRFNELVGVVQAPKMPTVIRSKFMSRGRDQNDIHLGRGFSGLC